MVNNALLPNLFIIRKLRHPDTKLPISDIMKRMSKMGKCLCAGTGCRHSVIQRL